MFQEEDPGDRGDELLVTEDDTHKFLIAVHAYLPPPSYPLLSQISASKRGVLTNLIHEEVYTTCYEPLLVKTPALPSSMVVSMYGTLREWLMAEKQEGFQLLKQNISKTHGKEYRVLGDTYLHIELPQLPFEDQETLIKFGLKAFKQDFGFTPKGFWLTNQVASTVTLGLLKQHGVEFVILGSNQVSHEGNNPISVPVEYKGFLGRTVRDIMPVILYDAALSQEIINNPDETYNADTFLESLRRHEAPILAIGASLEDFGYRFQFKDYFLRYVTNPGVMNRHGFESIFVKEEVRMQSDNPVWADLNSDRTILSQGQPDHLGEFLDLGSRLNIVLNKKMPGWGNSFVTFFLGIREAAFGRVADIEKAVDLQISQKDRLKDPTIIPLFMAKVAQYTGMSAPTSTFDDKGQIARDNLQEMVRLMSRI